jgi:hypothetical protein
VSNLPSDDSRNKAPGVYKDVDMNKVLKDRERRERRKLLQREKGLKTAGLLHFGTQVLQTYTDKHGGNWVYWESEGKFIKTCIYMPLLAIIKKGDI